MKYLLGILGVLLSWTAMAQMPDDEPYYPYAELELRSDDPYSDSTLFYRAIRLSEDLYGAITDYNLPRVTIYRRGETYRHERNLLHGVELPYRYQRAVRMLGAQEQRWIGATGSAGLMGTTGGLNSWSFDDALPLQPYEASAHVTDRNYRIGAHVRMNREVGNWHFGASVETRVGRDAQIEGLFTESFTAALRLSRSWSDESRLTLFGVLPYTMRGMRSATTEEAFTLTNDPYYNPSWGFQGGKVRNARVRREALPYLMAEWQPQLTQSTRMALSTSWEAGLSRQSGLGWYDARTPLPDNYRYMPSYVDDRATEEAWMRNDVRYTQIRWDELVAQNRMGGGEAIYALEDQVSRPIQGVLRLGFESDLGEVQLHYGVQVKYNQTRFYKTINDLLGAQYLTDIDHYLIDDATYANQFENNLRDPGRKVVQGDRFGYDYALQRVQSAGWIEATWRTDRLHLSVAGEVGRAMITRYGYYEKELFPGDCSYGSSRHLELNPYRLRATGGWAFSPRRYLELTLATGAEPASTANYFIQPLYNNRTIQKPDTERYHTAQIRYRMTHTKWEFEAGAFYTLHLDGVETRRYFDDLSGEYADLSICNIGTQGAGIEGAFTWRPAYRWRLSVAASWGDYRYVRDPQVTILADTDNRPIEVDALSHMRDCRMGGTPAFTAATQLFYSGAKGWSFRLSSGYVGGRYIDPALLRRTDRVARQNGVTKEAFEAFTHQERLADAMTLDVALYKRFTFERHTLHLSLQVNNLLGAEQVAYGYESMRSMRIGEDTGALRMPQPSRYLYAQPRTVSMRVRWQF